ncbi:MAG: stage II sporulation protein P [Clostridia bacterium]|nr:stage II sporulation protein P [Clostridia bacterium]
MIRIRVFKAYELAVAAAALLLIAALVFLLVSSFSREDASAASLPAQGESEYRPVSGSSYASIPEEAAQAVFSVSGSEAPLFGARQALLMPGEAISLPLRAQGEELIAWEKPPRVLIYHTHTYEAYTMEADGLYEETERWRTADNAYNVVRVGEALAEELRLRGIEVVQDITNHELPALNTAYARSLETLSHRMEGGEEYDLCIDLHRDAYSPGTGENTVDTPLGKAAKCMFLIGRGENFALKPDAAANEELAQQLTGHMNATVPGLCRDVRTSANRYNQHLGERALLIEAGNNMNTITEVLRAVPYLADAIAQNLFAQQAVPEPESPVQLLQNVKYAQNNGIPAQSLLYLKSPRTKRSGAFYHSAMYFFRHIFTRFTMKYGMNPNTPHTQTHHTVINENSAAAILNPRDFLLKKRAARRTPLTIPPWKNPNSRLKTRTGKFGSAPVILPILTVTFSMPSLARLLARNANKNPPANAARV